MPSNTSASAANVTAVTTRETDSDQAMDTDNPASTRSASRASSRSERQLFSRHLGLPRTPPPPTPAGTPPPSFPPPPHPAAPLPTAGDNRPSPPSAALLMERDDLDAVTMRAICTALVRTMQGRENQHQVTINALGEQVDGLAARVLEYESTFNHPPEGYVANTHYPHLVIPMGNGLSRPVKWVKAGENGNMWCYCAEQGEHDAPYVVPIYASPAFSTESPIEPLPPWFRNLLRGPTATYNNLLSQSKTLDDWGVPADIARYRSLDDEERAVALQIRVLEEDMASLCHARKICEGRLEASRCAESLAFMEGLAPGVRRPIISEVRTFDPDDQVARRVRPRRGPLGA